MSTVRGDVEFLDVLADDPAPVYAPHQACLAPVRELEPDGWADMFDRPRSGAAAELFGLAGNPAI